MLEARIVRKKPAFSELLDDAGSVHEIERTAPGGGDALDTDAHERDLAGCDVDGRQDTAAGRFRGVGASGNQWREAMTSHEFVEFRTR